MLEEAARRYGAHIDIRWHAYELRPEPIPQPDPDSEYIREHWEKRVLPMAAERGLEMKVPRRQVRSRRALQAALFAQDHGRFREMDYALFRARFVEDADISDIDVLRRLARETTLDDEALAYAVTTNSYVDRVNDDIALAVRLGINGVPAALVGPEHDDFGEFLRNAEPVVGAVPYDWMARAIDRALSGESPLARSARRSNPSS